MVKQTKPDYYRIIPEHLYKDADALVDYVRYFPYQFPTECPYCGHHSFKQTGDMNAAGQPRFNCHRCERNFSRLTGSYFAHMSHMELWPDFVIYRLSGLSFQKISRLLHISENACQIREKKLYQMMQDLFPDLFKWWRPHHEYKDRKVTEQVAKERSTFIKWLKSRIEQQTANCPLCGKFIAQRAYVGGHYGKESQNKNRPYFECSRCRKSFSLFKDTPLDKLTHIDLWLPFARGLCQGKSNYQIMATLPKVIMKQTASNWRGKFIEQMKIMQLNELVFWLEWQRSRNKGAETRKVKQREARKKLRGVKKFKLAS